LVFAGTPDFALESLRSLVAADFTPLAVLTQPDRPAGRGRKVKASPVKRYAEAQGIPVWQPATLRNSGVAAQLARLEPDAVIVAAYGLLFPEDILALPRAGCINVHASLLPAWRGAAPIQAAILAGDRETGISLMRMERGLDAGPVYVQQAIPIGDRETAGELQARLAALAGELLVTRLDDILAGRLPPVPQDASKATCAPRIRKEDAQLDWQLPALALQRKVRAYNPVPGTHFVLEGERVKCWAAERVGRAAAAPGTVIAAGRSGIEVACGEGVLRLLELQRPGRGRISAFEFANQVPLVGRRLSA
jgi:methionyl-tRNA formyltransferase